ncbi:MAG: hypothetical protein R2862_05800 [Thermoanaerobaculia bacterium]
MAPFAGRRIVTYHPTWRYFARRFGLDSTIYLEPKLGFRCRCRTRPRR